MNKKTWFFQITGWTCIAGSIILFVLAQTDYILAGKFFDKPVFYVPGIILGLSGIFFEALHLIIYKKNKSQQQNINMFEILTKYSGQITPKEFSQESGLSTEESRSKLDDMYRNGACMLYVTANGLLIYHFPDFELDGIVTKY